MFLTYYSLIPDTKQSWKLAPHRNQKLPQLPNPAGVAAPTKEQKEKPEERREFKWPVPVLFWLQRKQRPRKSMMTMFLCLDLPVRNKDPEFKSRKDQMAKSTSMNTCIITTTTKKIPKTRKRYWKAYIFNGIESMTNFSLHFQVTNSHDGPARNQISRGDKSREKPTPEANEVVPSRGSKTRGRQLGEEETVNEERLPANTRFPPRLKKVYKIRKIK